MMKKVIAVHPDKFPTKLAGIQSFSKTWLDYLSRKPDYEVREVDLYSESALSSLSGVSAVLWRSTGLNHAFAARRIIPAIEYGLSIPTLPSARMTWITRDKVAQSLLLDAAALPTPKNWIFFNAEDANAFLRTAQYPLVAKLAGGRGSSDVVLIHSASEGQAYVKEMFRYGVGRLSEAVANGTIRGFSRLKHMTRFLCGNENPLNREGAYAYFQEFLPRNDSDTRVTIIGKYATAFRRHNRPGDFRASGSGLIDWNQESINFEAVRLAHRVSRKIDCPFIAIDILYRDDAPLVCELNFSYLTWPVAKCPGYWVLPDEHGENDYQWIDSPLNPELLTLQEFFRINNL